MWLKELYDKGREIASGEYPDSRERDSLLDILLEDILHLSRYSVLTDPFQEIDDRSCVEFLGRARRLAAGEPVQYVVGWAEFYGRRFKVTPSVLIPRQETEQLCREVIENTRLTFPDRVGAADGQADGEGEAGPLRILDLCTGSGCIAWTLALELPGSRVTGVDVSPDALEVAESQGLAPFSKSAAGCSAQTVSHGANRPSETPKFAERDILRGPGSLPPECGDEFDLIVSNPPYVRMSERPLMRRNVLEHEPSLALFVPDRNPLKFYKAIRDWALRLLVPGGLLFLEINEALSEETEALFYDFSSHGIFNDYFGKPRFIFARR